MIIFFLVKNKKKKLKFFHTRKEAHTKQVKLLVFILDRNIYRRKAVYFSLKFHNS